MAPNIFKSLRRRSKTSIRADQQSTTDDSSEGGGHSQATGPSSGAVTPASSRSDPALNLQVQGQTGAQKRPPLASNTNRYSVSGMSGLGSAPTTHGRPNLPVSRYAPRLENLQDGKMVFQKVLLLHGTIGQPSHHDIDGSLTVKKLNDDFPAITWPVCSSRFKAMVYLEPGPNKIRLEFSSPKISNSSTSNPIHVSYVTVHMMPPLGKPPLHLAILLGKDSPGEYDATPARAQREGNGLDTAVRKFRMAGYLWQAFTAEQMFRHEMGRRTFRLEEEWMPGTATHRDRENGSMRSEAKVHIIRSDKTVAEIRDMNKAQQYSAATDKNALFGIAADAVRQHFQPLPGQKHYVAVLVLDAHWDRDLGVLTGHAALGGASGDLHLGIFGSHCLQSYPASVEEVGPAFTDCTPTDTNYVANDCNEAGSSWEAANIGLGAHLHEIGHLFGCPHQESGIMLRDYIVFNRTFVAREAYSTRTKSKGGLCRLVDECEWHRLDALRFKAHPVFKLPFDPPPHPDGGVQAYPMHTGTALIVATSGISFVEIVADGDDVCHTWIEYDQDLVEGGQRQVNLIESDLRKRLPPEKQGGKYKVSIKSHGGGSLDIDDFKQFVSKEAVVKLEDGAYAFRSRNVGQSKMDGSESREVVFTSAVKQERVLNRVVVYHGSAVDGLEFFYDDESSQLFGERGGVPGGHAFELDVRKGECIAGFYVRAGFWIDGIQILTNLGRKSEVFGNAHGGEPYTLLPPRGYTVCGISGSCGRWLDGFSVLVRQ